MSTVVIWSKSKPDVEFQYSRRFGEFNGMSSQSHLPHCRVLPPGEFNGISSQSHVSHCRVLPLGEFTVTIPEPHTTLQGVRIPSAILKIVFAIFIFLFLMQFRLWRAVAFVLSPIHLLYWLHCMWLQIIDSWLTMAQCYWLHAYVPVRNTPTYLQQVKG